MRLSDNEAAIVAMIEDAVRDVDEQIRRAQANGPGSCITVAGEVFELMPDGSLKVTLAQGAGRPPQTQRATGRSSSAEKEATS